MISGAASSSDIPTLVSKQLSASCPPPASHLPHLPRIPGPDSGSSAGGQPGP